MLNRFYNILPLPLQNAAISTYGLYWKQRRFGGVFDKEYIAFKERESYSAQQWHEYQTRKLREILAHAFNNVPYYNQLFRNAGLSLTFLNNFELCDLNRIPILSKSVLREKGNTEMLAATRERGGAFMNTSGTTGTPIQILYSHAMHQRLFAIYECRVRNWAGVNRTMKRASFGGRRIIPDANARPPYYRINYAEKQIYLSSYHISSQTAKNYVDGIRKFGAEYITGYAMSNYILARFIEESGMKVPQMKAMVLSSEKLTSQMRQTFEKVYGCKSYDAWSGVENCGLISENEYGQLLVSPDMGIVEVLNDNNEPVKPGETGHVVCTGFLNYDQPLIRYKIGDRVTLAADQHTKCGRVMTVISDIEGRIEEIITGPDGRKMVRFHGIFTELKSVIEAQLIQHTLYDYEIRLITSGSLAESDRYLMTQRLYSQLGKVNIIYTEVSKMQRGENGKFRSVISYLSSN